MGRPRKAPPTSDDIRNGSDDMARLEELENDEDPKLPEVPKLNEPPDRLAAAKAEMEAEAKAPKGQGFFDGLGPVRHQAIDDAAEIYNSRKLERCNLSKLEKEAKNALLLKMIAHGLNRYKTNDGWVVEICSEQKVRTKRDDGESVSSVGHGINPDHDPEDDAFGEIDDEEAA